MARVDVTCGNCGQKWTTVVAHTAAIKHLYCPFCKTAAVEATDTPPIPTPGDDPRDLSYRKDE